MRSPLDGITILDVTIWQNGPWGTVMLSDMGANVIKIEDKTLGDPGRTTTGQLIDPKPVNSYFETMNRNKRSVTLDLKNQQGREIFYEMAKKVDVITQNFRVGVVEKLGIDYETIRKINSQIVYASVSGYGSEGPDAKEGVFDILGQARGGFLYMACVSDDEVAYNIPSIADQTGAITLAYAVLLGIVARERYGVGQHVETSQLAGQLMLQALPINSVLLNGNPPLPRQRLEANNALFNTYKCLDGKWIAMGCSQSDRYWSSFARILGLANLEHDPRYKDHRSRQANRKTLVPLVDAAFLTKTRDEWIRQFKADGVLCAPVQSYADLPDDPQVIANNYLAEIKHPTQGTLREVGVPVRLSETPGWARTPAPEFGEHTEEVLLEFGYTWEQIERFRSQGAI